MEIDIRIESRVEAEVEVAEGALRARDGVTISRGRPSRAMDPVTVLSVAGSAASILQALCALRDLWLSRGEGSVVAAENEAGQRVLIVQATQEELERLLRPDENN
ncbi:MULTISPECIES: hypothetical protein [Streptomyces]|uniref:hypothetical protein n=1 Tax=Streptomyces TaxID=1883 RepID=UPI00369047CD